MLLINQVKLSKNPVQTGEEVLLSVEIVTWDSLKAKHTWNSLKNSGETWDSLRDKAVQMSFDSTWDESKEKYTWNSLVRYGVTWDELKGDKQ